MKKIIQQLLATSLATLMLMAITVTPVSANNAPRRFTPTEMDAWITGASAILNYHNHELPNLFAQNLRPNHRTEARRMSHQILNGRQWNIHTREDLLSQINSLLVWGHNGNFWEDFLVVAPIMIDGGVELLEELVIHEGLELDVAMHMLNIYDIAMYWGEAGIVAWDMFRVGSLLVWGYHAEFVTRNEARELMLPAVHILLEHFDSWEDAALNYLDGMLYWRRGLDQEVINRIDLVERMFEREDPVFNNTLFE